VLQWAVADVVPNSDQRLYTVSVAHLPAPNVPRPLTSRYLAENATPEWKRAYIDYRAAKKAIKRVANRLKQTPEPIPGNESNKSDDGDVSGASSSGDDDDHGPSKPRRGASARSPAVPPASTALVPRGVLGPWTPPAAAGTPPAPSQAASMSASHPASQASPLHAGTPSTRRATPKVSAKVGSPRAPMRPWVKVSR
jgi:hypothetical protein